MREDMLLRVIIANGPNPEVWTRRGPMYPLHDHDHLNVGDFGFMVRGSTYRVAIPRNSTDPTAEVEVEAVYHANAVDEPRLDELRETLIKTGFDREDGEENDGT